MNKKQKEELQKHFGNRDIKNISKIDLLDKIIYLEEMRKEDMKSYSEVSDYDIWRMNNE